MQQQVPLSCAFATKSDMNRKTTICCSSLGDAYQTHGGFHVGRGISPAIVLNYRVGCAFNSLQNKHLEEQQPRELERD
jgi:hypothetical protein